MRKNDRYYCTEEPKESASSKLKRSKARQYNRAMLSGRTIGFIGAGNMAEALISGLLHGKRITPVQLLASDINASKVARLRENYKIEAASTNRDVAKQADVLILAVEPQALDETLADLEVVIREETLLISVAAGYPIARIAHYVPGTTQIVRSMPNTPSLIREGVTAVAYDDRLSDAHASIVRALFESIGQVVKVEEGALDAVTGLSGGGPAYVYVMIEALADGGVKAGLPRETAQLLAAQTVSGAARMVLELREHPGMLKDRVASPGGTTISGLHELERGGLRATLISAVEAATRRSQELGTTI